MKKEFFYIHSKFYDLDSIKKSHPGGYLKIFECIGNEKDCTALFESSHCMKDIKKIYELLQQYEIKPENYRDFGITAETIAEKNDLPKFNFDNYHELANEVRQGFKEKKNYKVNNFWYIKLSLLFVLYFACYLKGLVFNRTKETFFYENYLCAFLSGIIWVSIGFCIMHDASHYALFKTKEKTHYDRVNENCIINNFFLEKLSNVFNYNLAIGKYSLKNKSDCRTDENQKNKINNNDYLNNDNGDNSNYANENNETLTNFDKIDTNVNPNDNPNKDSKEITIKFQQTFFGLLEKSSNIINKNDILNSIWQGWSLWNSYIWFKHHTYAHHSFTGIFGLDPDLIHLRPLARKAQEDSKVVEFLVSIQRKTIWLILIFLPGMFMGQVIGYFVGALRGHIWKVSISQVVRKTPFIELLLYFTSALVLIFNKNFICVYLYFIGLNLMYALCIVPDHDTFESAIENDKQTEDWCEMQIRKSGNFCEESLLITELNGGINFQIQHHLFPTIAHCHYRTIAQKVREFCMRKGFPYVAKKNLKEVYDSYMKTIEYASIVQPREKKY